MKRGSPSSTSSSASRNGATAGAIEGEWKAPATGSRIARLPSSPASFSASSSRSRSPASTIWPGALSLATVMPGGLRDLARLGVVGADEGEHRAAVVGLGHQAAAQHDELERVVDRRARRRRRGRPSSPSEWPAATAGATSSPSPRQPAIEAQKMAGCWKRVLSSTRAKGSSPTSSSARSSSSWAALRDELAHVGRLAPLPREAAARFGLRGHRGTPLSARLRPFPVGGPAHPPAGGVMRVRWGVPQRSRRHVGRVNCSAPRRLRAPAEARRLAARELAPERSPRSPAPSPRRRGSAPATERAGARGRATRRAAAASPASASSRASSRPSSAGHVATSRSRSRPSPGSARDGAGRRPPMSATTIWPPGRGAAAHPSDRTRRVLDVMVDDRRAPPRRRTRRGTDSAAASPSRRRRWRASAAAAARPASTHRRRRVEGHDGARARGERTARRCPCPRRRRARARPTRPPRAPRSTRRPR